MNQSNGALKDILRKEGLRYTNQRQSIWDEIRSNHDHRDAEDIYISIRNNGVNVSRATVYRTIDVLVKNRFVRKMDLGEGRFRYEPRLDDKHHDHMVCEETGDIIEYFNQELEDLQEKIANEFGYTVVRHVHQLFVKPLKK
ncbi:MAG: transcriptional repressor [Candidatus Marinimicrobia bacterium]|jgi:Fe2+ or Zn2+ uptake regulation protein|nr:transcriptional repressor [Candidatus Neomarinimicrobiota bacterium]MBT3501913.1 transcriptional repressor [Candidatus Neomarinimicrobiota bacterium]MBT3838561.1 transcriptional repressor [Candidatus Neomarinimicrobiota bacterium]MBT3999825.1 transcriptional repressor [Candidatus Neomarinimicrobiota bacterium]MBT4281880.1 transcriptional repressor [Candidatus Neomarinimicrobiota bacterium]